MSYIKTNKNQAALTIILLICLSLLLISRLLLSIKAPIGLYGYDFGFYLFAAKNATNLLRLSNFSGIFGGFNNPLFFIGHYLGIPAVALLQSSYFLASIALGLATYLFFNKKNKAAALLSIILLACSLIQSEAYSMFLWKNIMALPLLVLGFWLFEDKKWLYFTIISSLVIALHRTTGIFYILSILTTLGFYQIQKKEFKILFIELISIAVLATGLYPYYSGIVSNLISNSNYFVRVGVFLNYSNKWLLMLPEIILAVISLHFAYKKREWSLFHTLSIISLLWILLTLPFYHRVFIYLDLSLIMMGSLTLSYMYFNKNILTKSLLVILLIVLSWRSFAFISSKEPYISSTAIEEIQNFTSPGPTPFILATSADDAPWLLGFANNARLGAPGLFESKQSQPEWIEFWNGENWQSFTSTYPRPLYLYQKSYTIPGPINACLEQISDHFYKYTCN